jgi:UDP-GlcNAc:undecaprenyl-phosphate GlcNAc-1-phosphate transferase
MLSNAPFSRSKPVMMLVVILAFLTALTLTYITLPSIIGIARFKRLFDEPNDRSSHTENTPSLGGIGIFAGAVFSIVLWMPADSFGKLQYVLCAFIIIFLIGAKDDIAPMPASKKMVGQFLAATILVFKSEIRLEGFYGVFGMHDQLWEGVYIILSIFTILVIINAFNLIDGINGLAGSLGALILSIFGVWFFLVGRLDYAILAFATVGAVMAFLKYNYTPTQIFMGDTGSLLIGMVCSLLSIMFIRVNAQLPESSPYVFEAAPSVAFGILIVPLFDTLRVFVTRILQRRSPFKPDRNHIHHLLVDYGFTHMQATGVLVMINMTFIVYVVASHRFFNVHTLFFSLLLFANTLTFFLRRAVSRRREYQVRVGDD